jgi:hypothetical protein
LTRSGTSLTAKTAGRPAITPAKYRQQGREACHLYPATQDLRLRRLVEAGRGKLPVSCRSFFLARGLLRRYLLPDGRKCILRRLGARGFRAAVFTTPGPALPVWLGTRGGPSNMRRSGDGSCQVSTSGFDVATRGLCAARPASGRPMAHVIGLGSDVSKEVVPCGAW